MHGYLIWFHSIPTFHLPQFITTHFTFCECQNKTDLILSNFTIFFQVAPHPPKPAPLLTIPPPRRQPHIQPDLHRLSQLTQPPRTQPPRKPDPIPAPLHIFRALLPHLFGPSLQRNRRPLPPHFHQPVLPPNPGRVSKPDKSDCNRCFLQSS